MDPDGRNGAPPPGAGAGGPSGSVTGQEEGAPRSRRRPRTVTALTGLGHPAAIPLALELRRTGHSVFVAADSQRKLDRLREAAAEAFGPPPGPDGGEGGEPGGSDGEAPGRGPPWFPTFRGDTSSRLCMRNTFHSAAETFGRVDAMVFAAPEAGATDPDEMDADGLGDLVAAAVRGFAVALSEFADQVAAQDAANDAASNPDADAESESDADDEGGEAEDEGGSAGSGAEAESPAEGDAAEGADGNGNALTAPRAPTDRRGGSAILVLTTAGRAAPPEGLAEAALQGALEGMMRAAAVTYGRRGITVNAVLVHRPRSAKPASYSRRTPLRTRPKEESVAAAVRFLASKGAPDMTGQAVVLDGGRSALDGVYPADAD